MTLSSLIRRHLGIAVADGPGSGLIRFPVLLLCGALAGFGAARCYELVEVIGQFGEGVPRASGCFAMVVLGRMASMAGAPSARLGKRAMRRVQRTAQSHHNGRGKLGGKGVARGRQR